MKGDWRPRKHIHLENTGFINQAKKRRKINKQKRYYTSFQNVKDHQKEKKQNPCYS